MENKVNPSETNEAALEELLIATEAEKNQLQKERDEWKKRVLYLEQQNKAERESFSKAVRNYRRRKMRSLRWPAVVLVVAAFLAVLAMLGMLYQLVDPRAGYPLAGLALVCCSIAAGVVWERASR